MHSTLATAQTRPFLKWPGGKQWLCRYLARGIGSYHGTYIEPFLGGGALFFALTPQKAFLGDTNARLIETYCVVRDDMEGLIGVLKRLSNDQHTYYAVRRETYSDPVDRAAQFIYLNKSCWNGLYRVNRDGFFNVPYGHNGRSIFDPDHLRLVSTILRRAVLRCSDFAELVEAARSGDVVYLDPPYTVLHSNNGFRRYNEKLFTWEDQQRLGDIARDLARRRCLVIVSNSSHPSVLELYAGYHRLRLRRTSTLAASSLSRSSTEEALFVSSRQLAKTLLSVMDAEEIR
jgi:DNA adenine methylase